MSGAERTGWEEGAEGSLEPHSDAVKQMQNNSYKYIQWNDWTSGVTQLYHKGLLTVVICVIVLYPNFPLNGFAVLLLPHPLHSEHLWPTQGKHAEMRERISLCLHALPLTLGFEGAWGGNGKQRLLQSVLPSKRKMNSFPIQKIYMAN